MKLKLVVLAVFVITNIFSQVPENAEDISPLLIGETLPTVILLDSDGNQVEFNDVISKKPTVLVFYRGGWCPYCNRQLSALAEVEKEILAFGYQIVAISPDHFEMLKPTTENEKLEYQLFSDQDAKLIQDVGIGFKTPEKAKGYIFKKTSKEATDILPVPTVMIIDKKGKILFEYINPDYSTRLSPEVLIANLKALKF